MKSDLCPTITIGTPKLFFSNPSLKGIDLTVSGSMTSSAFSVYPLIESSRSLRNLSKV